MPLSKNTKEMPIFDGHNDSLLRVCRPGRSVGRSFLSRGEEGHLDLPRAREAGFSGGFFAIFVPSPEDDPLSPPDPHPFGSTGDGYGVKLADPIDSDYAAETASEMVSCLYDLEESADGAVKVVTDVHELDDCLSGDVLAIVLHFEGAEPIDPRLRNLEGFYQRGLRSLGIVWSRPNAFGWGVPFWFPATPDIGPGLTREGKDLVRACNELGIVLDLSHINELGFWDVARRSDFPLVATHSAVHALAPASRNLTDAQLEAIAESNGVVGINFEVHFLSSDGGLQGDVPLTALVRHIDYVAQRFGIEHVAFGSDFDGATIPKEMGDVTGLPRLLAALGDYGFDEDALRKLTHQNWIRVLRETWRH